MVAMETLPGYYGHYRSSMSAQTGCVKELVTTAHAKVDFPVMIAASCNLCKTTHNFRFAYSHAATTPKQRQQLDAWCVARGIDTEFEI